MRVIWRTIVPCSFSISIWTAILESQCSLFIESAPSSSPAPLPSPFIESAADEDAALLALSGKRGHNDNAYVLWYVQPLKREAQGQILLEQIWHPLSEVFELVLIKLSFRLYNG